MVDPDPSPAPVPPAAPVPPSVVASAKPRRGPLRWLFRSVLGCCALAVGALIALALLAPAILSPLAPRIASWVFERSYQGKLSVREAHLAWSGEQSLRGVELRDPAGASVATLDLELPGILALIRGGGRSIGRVRIECSADLEAADDGTTNLDRALAPREPQSETKEEGGTSPQVRERLEELDLDLDLVAPRIAWSDARTRALGKPFVLRDLRGTAKIAPHQPIEAQLTGRLEGETPGELALQARVENPFAAPTASAPPRLHFDLRVDGFATALVDGLAGQRGRLTAALGPTFSLKALGEGATDSGEVKLDFESEHARVHFGGGVSGGVLRNAEGELGGLDASLDAQPALVRELGAAFVPAGASLEAAAGPARWSVRASRFEVPIGAWLEANAKQDPRALETLVRGTRASVELALGSWRYEDPTLRAKKIALEVVDLATRAEIAPQSEGSSVTLSAQVRAGASAPSPLRAVISVPELAQLVDLRADRALAPIRVECDLPQAPTDVLGVLAPQGADLAQVLGPELSVHLASTTSLVEAPNAAARSGGESLASALADWRALGRRVTSASELTVTGSGRAAPSALTGGQPLGLASLRAKVSLAPDEPLELSVAAEFVSSRPGKLALDARVGQLFQEPSAKLPLEVAFELAVDDFPTPVIDGLAAQGGRVTQLVGDVLAVHASGRGTADAGELKLDLDSERSQVRVIGRFADGRFVSGDEPAVRLQVQPVQEWFVALVKPHLPEGVALTLEESRGSLGVNVNFLSLPVRELLERREAGPDAMLDTLLARARIEAVASFRELHYEDARLRAQKLALDHLGLEATIVSKPEDAASPFSLDVALTAPALPEVKVHAETARPREVLGLTRLPGGAAMSPLTLNVSAKALPVRYLDAWSGGGANAQSVLGPSLDLLVRSRVEQAAGKPLAARVDLELAGKPGKTVLGADLKVSGPFAPRAPGELPPLEATLDLQGSETLLAALPPSVAAPARELLGDAMHAAVKHEGGAASSRFSLELRAAGVELAASGGIEKGVLAMQGKDHLSAKVSRANALVKQFLAPSLPPGAGVEIPAESGPLALEVGELRVPLAFGEAAPGALAQPDALAQRLGALEARVSLALPSVRYTHPPPPPAPKAASGAPNDLAPAPGAPTSVVLRDLKLDASLKRGEPARAHLAGVVDATPPGAIDVDLVGENLAAFLAPETEKPAWSLTVNGKLSRLPTAIVDALARQDGLLVDVIGPELEATVQGRIPSAEEPLRAEVHSPSASVKLVGQVDRQTLQAGSQGAIDASVPLTPLFSRRIVGNLVPLLVNLSKPQDAGPALLTARAFSLPLSKDLSKLSGEITLDLGAVNYELLPGLSNLVSGLKGGGPKATQLPPLTIKIDQGVARYESLPIRIAGREYSFKGSYDLVRSEFKLTTEIPLEVLGSGIEDELDRVRDVLDPKTLVPIEISGTWSKPRVRLGNDFMEKVVKKAAESALKKGLGDLLGPKKKKKD